MKKIFSIIAAVIFGFVIILISVMAGVKKDIGFDLGAPDFINVYNKSTTVLNNGQAYEKEDKEYGEILEMLKKTTTLSLLQLAQNNNNLFYKPEYDTENFSTYDSSMKNENIVIELIYSAQRDVVAYDNSNPRVVPYICLLFVISDIKGFQDIIVYSSLSNDTSSKEEQYRSCTPIVLKGVAKKLIKYIEKLS